MNKKGQILLNLGQIIDSPPPSPPKQHVNLEFWNKKMPTKIQKGHYVQLPHAIIVQKVYYKHKNVYELIPNIFY